MTLKKSKASRRGPDGNWIPQQDITMHALEEDMVRKHWAMNDAKKAMGSMPQAFQEHEWMVQHGPEYVREQRVLAQSKMDANRAAYEVAMQEADRANARWIAHCEACARMGHDPDTTPEG